jgi:hypothetical protein
MTSKTNLKKKTQPYSNFKSTTRPSRRFSENKEKLSKTFAKKISIKNF